MRTGLRRTTAAATAGLLLLTGALPHASAQPSSTPAAAKPNSVPPDLPPNAEVPRDTGEPDVPYVRTTKGCVESDTKTAVDWQAGVFLFTSTSPGARCT